jgi:hypothetical protein
MSDQKTPDGAPKGVDFAGLVLGLFSAALYHMGETPIEGQPVGEVNLPMAKQNIDFLDVLKEKTQGNLNGDEGKMLIDVITDLKMKYSSKSSAKSSS